jgi:RNA polymerase sigma factor (sigma-70 family)
VNGENGEREARLRASLERSGVFLVDELGGRLTALARSRGLGESDAEEVVQEALAAVYVRRAEIDSPEAWLVRVVDRRCCDWYRRRQVQERAHERLAARARERRAAPSGDGLDLEKALRQLPKKLRKVVRLRYIEGLGCAEAAERLGYSPASYRSTLGRTLRSLRALLDAAAPDAPSPG